MRRILAVLLVGAIACGPTETAGGGGAGGVPGGAASRSDQVVIRDEYLERLRLGLGSPFRLMDFALADPRLDDELRRDLARGLLQRAARGEMYEIDPVVLLPSGLPPAERVAQAWAHLDLIERVVSGSDDPRAGELVIRLAYQLAVLEGSVLPPQRDAALAVAALLRDREVAVRDARVLLSAARQGRSDPVEMIRPWREERRFMVERPVVATLEERLQLQALRSAPAVLSSVRSVALGIERPGIRRPPFSQGEESLVRLPAIADSMNLPPRAALVTALRGVGSALPASLGPAERAAWKELEIAATDEERFVGARAALLDRHPRLRTALATAGLYAAVGLRGDAQERVWYPGMEAPTLAELKARYGVDVVVAPGVPDRWIPFYASLLEQAHADLRRVVPDLSLFGLTVRITLDTRTARRLASHDPGTRVLEWPVTTGRGTLAHEVAHDLDWQAARRANASARSYASESVSRPPPASLRAALDVLTPTSEVTIGLPARRFGHARRPAETVARTFDWFIVSRLASLGRSNGALSSAQDELFTGNGSLGPPGVSRGYAPAVIEVVRSLVTIPPAHRAGFLAEYGPLQWPTPFAFLGAVSARLDALRDGGALPAPMGVPTERLAEISAVRDEMLQRIDASRCEGAIPLLDPALHREYRRLVTNAALAAARATALRAARDLGGDEAVGWMTAELYGLSWLAPEEPPAEAATLEAVAAEVRGMRAATPPLLRSGFEISTPLTLCRPSPTALRFGLGR